MSLENKHLTFKGDKYGDWHIYYDDEGADLLVGSLLVSECGSLQQAIQDMLNIELESNWISVEGSLPNYREDVLILVNGELLNVGQYDNKYEGCWIIGNIEMLWDYDFNHSYEAVVTHWMHKPKLPKEENKQ